MPKRTDDNQGEIVDALRRAGAVVCDTHELGRGFPDLVVGWRGRNLLVEVKRPGERLNSREALWHRAWLESGGQVAVVSTVDEAVKLLQEGDKCAELES